MPNYADLAIAEILVFVVCAGVSIGLYATYYKLKSGVLLFAWLLVVMSGSIIGGLGLSHLEDTGFVSWDMQGLNASQELFLVWIIGVIMCLTLLTGLSVKFGTPALPGMDADNQ